MPQNINHRTCHAKALSAAHLCMCMYLYYILWMGTLRKGQFDFPRHKNDHIFITILGLSVNFYRNLSSMHCKPKWRLKDPHCYPTSIWTQSYLDTETEYLLSGGHCKSNNIINKYVVNLYLSLNVIHIPLTLLNMYLIYIIHRCCWTDVKVKTYK